MEEILELVHSVLEGEKISVEKQLQLNKICEFEDKFIEDKFIKDYSK